MFVLAHTGIALGAGVVTAEVWRRTHPTDKNRQDSWFVYLAKRADIRLLLVGSLLPDIIDKPLGMVFFREEFSSGRIFAHTLLFLVALIIAGAVINRRWHKNWCLVLAFGSLIHLVLDEMWLSPQVLFWPAPGSSFIKETGDWFASLYYELLTPDVMAAEIVGGIILLWLLIVLLSRKSLFKFIMGGRI